MSSKPFELSLFVFRRDLRVHDNTALIAALNESKCVIPCFIFDNRQIAKNHYFSEKAFRFMLDSLVDLSAQIEKRRGKLYFFEGVAEDIIQKLIEILPIDAVFFNRDYTPFSIKRDTAIKKIIAKKNKKLFVFSDALLNEPEEIMKADGTPYSIFTPFMKKSRESFVAKPRHCNNENYYTQNIHINKPSLLPIWQEKTPENKIMKGGRLAAISLLKNIITLKNYARDRDFPDKNATSHLSAHHKFGTVSIRETYHIASTKLNGGTFINELYWRDFFTHIVFHFPHVMTEAFYRKFSTLSWSNRTDYFNAWCNGQTGFPIVDAGMRELNQTGLMHNRVRMITASFLVKDLHINWREGENYFAKKLIDYDPAVNNGNWQWAASTGCDAQPYFRIFNPWLQQKRFDIDAHYIKKWIPELKSVPAKDIHDFKKLSAHQSISYPKPIIDHANETKITKAMYAEAASRKNTAKT